MPQEEKKTGPTNATMRRAASTKNDEFYTRREFIQSELRHYKSHFAGKTVYCNCDDPTISQFSIHFEENFSLLGLRKLVTTCYQSKNPLGFTKYKDKNGLKMVYSGKKWNDKMLNKDGDFRSDECVKLLRQADIVVTNPPFSLFREYVEQLVAEKKKFLIIGNKNAVSYKEIFRLIMAGKLWVGYNPMGVDMLFNVKPEFADWLVANKKEGGAYKIVDGVVKGRSSAIWFTNLDHQKRHEELIITAKYKGNESDYPKYDNYDAINVNFVKDIPCDYAGVMGVPITFLDKWNPKQFEILGIMNTGEENKGIRYEGTAHGRPLVNGVEKYLRLLIKNRRLK